MRHCYGAGPSRQPLRVLASASARAVPAMASTNASEVGSAAEIPALETTLAVGYITRVFFSHCVSGNLSTRF